MIYIKEPNIAMSFGVGFSTGSPATWDPSFITVGRELEIISVRNEKVYQHACTSTTGKAQDNMMHERAYMFKILISKWRKTSRDLNKQSMIDILKLVAEYTEQYSPLSWKCSRHERDIRRMV